jgi:hypothetical protein
MLDDIKPNTPVDALVLRKGRKETVKGVMLGEAKARPQRPGFQPFQFPNFPFPGGLPGGIGVGNVTITRTGDSFTATSSDGGTTFKVTGKVENGKATAESIEVTDGNQTKTYQKIEDVPEGQREKVKALLNAAGGNFGNLRFDLDLKLP